MLSEIGTSELTEWMAYDRLEPFGESRADYREASHMAMIANMNRKKGARRLEPSDFMPVWDERDRAQSDAQSMMSTLRALTSSND